MPEAKKLNPWLCRGECASRVPQFHGKWPFLRVLGLQEPASVLASGLNLAAALHMLGRFVAAVPRGAEMYWVGQIQNEENKPEKCSANHYVCCYTTKVICLLWFGLICFFVLTSSCMVRFVSLNLLFFL